MRRDNEAWVAALRGGGADQQDALADLRAVLLRGLRRAVAGNAHTQTLLEDAVQDSLVRILARLDQFEGRSRFLTWATSIAIRVAMSDLRRRRWKDVSFDGLVADAFDRIDNGEIGPDAQWARKAIVDKMHDVMRTELTEKQRTALLAELKGMPQDEIARHLGSNRNAVYKLTHDARRRLKRGLQAAGYDAADVESAFSA